MKIQDHPDYTLFLDQLIPLFKELEQHDQLTQKDYFRLIKRYTKPNGDVFAKDFLIHAYRKMAGEHGLQPFSESVIKKIRMKPIRTISGVTPLTVLTKPFPCPGQCIFCPSDVRMPKSYLSDEPGAQRAERNFFDPYLQTYNRLQAYSNIGHPVDKVEIIVLGGTWSFYPEQYQIWFISECFRALNDFGVRDDRQQVEKRYQEMLALYKKQKEFYLTDNPQDNQQRSQSHQIDGQDLKEKYNQVISKLYVAPERKAGFDAYQVGNWDDLFNQHQENERADVRCVGLVVETRPDSISEAEVIRIRKLGCTKTQIGVQSLQDSVLEKNNRGHDVAATRRAFRLLRQAGLKIHAHWMANLYGSDVAHDIQDFDQLYSDPDFKPDELKVYPCSLIQSAELMQYYQRGEWQPYTHDQLLEVVAHTLIAAPEYTRLTRVIRDIPSADIVDGNQLTNFRQIATQEVHDRGQAGKDIRAREVRNTIVDFEKIRFGEVSYTTSTANELFLQVEAPTKNRHQSEYKLLGFLRLSLPTQKPYISELEGSAIIREIHVYGPAQSLGKRIGKAAQHMGFGTQLIERAKKLAAEAGYDKIAVISAVGTREYYRKKGFSDGELYQFTSTHS